jgi:metallo-beta-lactamase class B
MQASLAAAVMMSSFLLAGAPVQAADKAINCGNCKKWNAPAKPFRVAGNTWYVGTAGLGAILVTSDQGHVLIDGALPQSVPRIEANIRALGFKLRDVKLILNSHAHWDHAGGLAALQRDTGAVVAASPSSAANLQRGGNGPDDPQYEAGQVTPMPKVASVRTLADGETVKVGPLALTAHFTPGHAPGGTTWTWQSCDSTRCYAMVYGDSITPVSRDGFHFGSGNGAGENIAGTFRASLATLAALPCDILITPHPDAADTFGRAARTTADQNGMVDPDACKAYAAKGSKLLDARLALEGADKK